MVEKTYQYATLDAFPELADQTDQLIERGLNYLPPHRFAVDFAPLAGPQNLRNRHVLLDPTSGEVVAHVGCLVRSFCWEADVVPVAMLGGISVDESLRGQGLFHELFMRVLTHYHSQCAFFLLWSDKHEMYAKYGFQLAGRQWCYLTPGEGMRGETTRLANVDDATLAEMALLYRRTVNRSAFSPLRDAADWEALKSIRSSELRLLKENGRLRGYYFRGKGMDLEGIVHDWAHEEGVAGLLKDAGAPGVVWAAENVPVDDETRQDLQLVGLWRPNTHPMALAKLSVLLGGAEVMWQDPYFMVRSQKGTFRLRGEELLEEIFSYGKHGVRAQGIPVWVGGLDSI